MKPFGMHSPKAQTPNLKLQSSNFKPQTSNLKPQTPHSKPPDLNTQTQTLTQGPVRLVAQMLADNAVPFSGDTIPCKVTQVILHGILGIQPRVE